MQMQPLMPHYQWSEYSPVDALLLKEQMQHEQNTKLQQLEAAHQKKFDNERVHADRLRELEVLKTSLMSPQFRGQNPQSPQFRGPGPQQ